MTQARYLLISLFDSGDTSFGYTFDSYVSVKCQFITHAVLYIHTHTYALQIFE